MELRQLVAVVPADLADKVYARAAADGQTLNELFGQVLTAYVADPEPSASAPRPRKSTKSARG